MKPVSEWDLAHILQLPLGEFDWVEFKGRRGIDLSLSTVDENKVLGDLSKQLSAFANSGGGVLVYGVFNPTDGTARSVDDGGVNFGSKKPNIREWLEDIIPSLVEFPLKKFNVYALTDGSGAPGLANDRCIVVIEIPDSEDAPHQAQDQKYYARVGGKSRPVGHRFVTDMFHRQRHARFEVKFGFQSHTWIPRSAFPLPPFVERFEPRRTVELFVSARNLGKVYAKYVALHLWVPKLLEPVDEDNEVPLNESEKEDYVLWENDNTRRDVLAHNSQFGTNHYGPSWFDPILPGLNRSWKFECKSTLRPEEIVDQKLRWEIHCDNAPSASGEVFLKDIQFAIRDEHEIPESDQKD